MDGAAYREALCGPQNSAHEISCQFNFDGVLLRKSAKTNLWPIHVATNELPVHLRFKPENMMIGGMWQEKNKHLPSFAEFC